MTSASIPSRRKLHKGAHPQQLYTCGPSSGRRQFHCAPPCSRAETRSSESRAALARTRRNAAKPRGTYSHGRACGSDHTVLCAAAALPRTPPRTHAGHVDPGRRVRPRPASTPARIRSGSPGPHNAGAGAGHATGTGAGHAGTSARAGAPPGRNAPPPRVKAACVCWDRAQATARVNVGAAAAASR